jgi:hypothetical protein
MTTPNIEEQATTTVAAVSAPAEELKASSEKPKATKKAKSGAQGAKAAPAKGKSSTKSTPAKKAPKTPRAKAPKPAKRESGAREGTKTETVLELLRRKNGASLKEIMKATGWLPHSIRGFLSGTVGKKMGLEVISTKSADGERTYSIKG